MSLLELLAHHMKVSVPDKGVGIGGSNPLSIYFKNKYMYDLKRSNHVAG